MARMYKTRNRVIDAKAVVLGLVMARLLFEFSYCRLVGKIEEFITVWAESCLVHSKL